MTGREVTGEGCGLCALLCPACFLGSMARNRKRTESIHLEFSVGYTVPCLSSYLPYHSPNLHPCTHSHSPAPTLTRVHLLTHLHKATPKVQYLISFFKNVFNCQELEKDGRLGANVVVQQGKMLFVTMASCFQSAGSSSNCSTAHPVPC